MSETARLKADPRRVYDAIANYHTTHPRIVPKQFSDLTVVKGGVGAGTEITFNVTVLGQKTKFRAVVSEPEPGMRLYGSAFGATPCGTVINAARAPDGSCALLAVVQISAVEPADRCRIGGRRVRTDSTGAGQLDTDHPRMCRAYAARWVVGAEGGSHCYA